MNSWTDSLIWLFPRVRDFRGINPNSFDGRGNYAMGIKEQLIFPEIEYDKIDKVRGMDIRYGNHRKHRRRSTGAAQADGRTVCRVRRDYRGKNIYESQGSSDPAKYSHQTAQQM